MLHPYCLHVFDFHTYVHTHIYIYIWWHTISMASGLNNQFTLAPPWPDMLRCQRSNVVSWEKWKREHWTLLNNDKRRTRWGIQTSRKKHGDFSMFASTIWDVMGYPPVMATVSIVMEWWDCVVSHKQYYYETRQTWKSPNQLEVDRRENHWM